MLGLWGIESAFGDPDVQKNHMRPVIPALAALAWGEPRRRAYWEQELLNALVIIERGWSTPEEMRGSWAGAMGHTQWMPEVWLNIGLDYDRDGRVIAVRQARRRARRHRALSRQARQVSPRRALGLRGARRGRRDPAKARRAATTRGRRPASARADGQPFPQPNATAKLWVPVPGGPAFLLGPNFYAVRSYNPSMNYTLSIVHLGDRIMGGGPFVQPFPGGERTPTLAEVQEIQKRLTALGFDTGGTDGRVGNDTMIAVRNFQRKVGMEPADGYAGVKLLARLRQGLVIRFYGARFARTTEPKDPPVTTAKAKAAAGRRKTCECGPSIAPRARAPGQSDRHQRAGLRQRRGRRHAARAAKFPTSRSIPARAIAGCTTRSSTSSATRRRRCCSACTRRARSRSRTATPR